MMATKRTQQYLAYLHHWRKRTGVKPGQIVSENTIVPPRGNDFATRHPVIDAVAGSAVMAAFIGGLIFLWIYQGALA